MGRVECNLVREVYPMTQRYYLECFGEQSILMDGQRVNGQTRCLKVDAGSGSDVRRYFYPLEVAAAFLLQFE